MYYPDLTPVNTPDSAVYFKVGWLDSEHEFPKGIVSDAFIDRLWFFCCHSEFLVYGYHYCPFCANPSFGQTVEHNGEVKKLGDGEIIVIMQERTFFDAPNLIFHYVVDHQYCPPEEFIQAVLESPLPGSKAYKKAAEVYSWF